MSAELLPLVVRSSTDVIDLYAIGLRYEGEGLRSVKISVVGEVRRATGDRVPNEVAQYSTADLELVIELADEAALVLTELELGRGR
jgi:hypothetical protein